MRQGVPKYLLQITDERNVVSQKTIIFNCVLFIAWTQKTYQLLVYINHSVIQEYEIFDGDCIKKWGCRICLIRSRRWNTVRFWSLLHPSNVSRRRKKKVRWLNLWSLQEVEQQFARVCIWISGVGTWTNCDVGTRVLTELVISIRIHCPCAFLKPFRKCTFL